MKVTVLYLKIIAFGITLGFSYELGTVLFWNFASFFGWAVG